MDLAGMFERAVQVCSLIPGWEGSKEAFSATATLGVAGWREEVAVF